MATASRKTFARQLEALRRKAGLTQEQAAAKCAVLVRSWLRYSSGEREPPEDRQAAMLALLAAAARRKRKPGPGFAAQLLAIVEREGITRRELAEAAGTTERTVHRWLGSEGRVPVDADAVLARVRERWPG